MFGSKKKAIEPVSTVTPETTEKIRIMPERFIVNKKKRKSNVFIVLLIIIMFLLIIFAGLVVVFFIQKPKMLSLEKNGNENINARVNTNTPVNEPSVEPTSSPTPPPTPSPTPSESELDATDIDNDMLTGEEERLFSTNANNPDTDSDGYDDAQEILSGYDPRLSNKTLEESDIATVFIFHGASFLYPSKWQANELTDTLVSLDTKKGDIITVSYLEDIFQTSNVSNGDIINWIKRDDPALTDDDIVDAKLKNVKTAYIARHLTKYYLFTNDLKNVFIYSYNVGSNRYVVYPIAFQMMVNSLKL